MTVPTHPIVESIDVIRAALKSVADRDPVFMRTGDKATALKELAGAEAQLVELRMRVMVNAADVADETAARDIAGWYAHETHTDPHAARRDQRLARALDHDRPVLARGVRDGNVSIAQAHVIAKAIDRLPAEVGVEILERAEATLVGYAADFGPRQLALLGRRILETVAPEIADEAEAARLKKLEDDARRKNRLALQRQGDGTTRISGLISDAAATRLATYLQAFANPRKAVADSDAAADPFHKLPYPRRLGEAFSRMLETMDTSRLPLHGGDATTIVITIGLDQLRRDLASADLLGTATIPGDVDEGAGDRLTAGEVRRLACTAHLIPAVLGGDSEVLDLGRRQRLFTSAQRRALLLRDGECRAEGCDIPGTWTEAHHWLPWSHDGPTDLDNAVLLCTHHHRRAHDDSYRTQRLPNGDIRYARRT